MLQQLQSVIMFKAAGLNVLDSFKQKYGFKPRVGTSLIEGGGCGVFAHGAAAAGSMVAIYPGLIIRDMRSVDELTCAGTLPQCVFISNILPRYGVLSSPPAVHYIASMPDTHASTIRCSAAQVQVPMRLTRSRRVPVAAICRFMRQSCALKR